MRSTNPRKPGGLYLKGIDRQIDGPRRKDIGTNARMLPAYVLLRKEGQWRDFARFADGRVVGFAKMTRAQQVARRRNLQRNTSERDRGVRYSIVSRQQALRLWDHKMIQPEKISD